MDGKNPSSQAGGPMGGLSGAKPAGGPMSNLPTTLPYTSAVSIPGAPVWGPGSTFVEPNAGQGGQQMPEIIGPQGNAYSLINGQWQPSGTNARPPGSPAPIPQGAPTNSIPGQALSPYLSAGALNPLQTQLQNQIAALKGKNTALGAPVIANDISQFFSNLPSTVHNTMPGGYVPGYQIPQDSLQYVPTSAATSLEQQLLGKPLTQKTVGGLGDIFSKFQTSVNAGSPLPGFNVPTLPGGMATGVTGDPRSGLSPMSTIGVSDSRTNPNHLGGINIGTATGGTPKK